MPGVLTNASMARIPASALARIGRLRAYAGVEVRLDGERAWVRWVEPGFEILGELLPIKGAEFFERVADPSTPRWNSGQAGSGQAAWHLCGRALPYFEIPDDGFQPLASVLSPKPTAAVPPDEDPLPKVVLALKRNAVPRRASAMLCTPKVLASWADMAVSTDIRKLLGAKSGELVLLVGRELPPIAGERYWGDRLLCPLGWSPDPGLPESAILSALDVGDHELALLRNRAVEVIPREVFKPLTRASARLGAAS